MMIKHWKKLLIAVMILGLFSALGVFIVDEVHVSATGVVCNDSSMAVWLTVTESKIQKPYALAPGECTNAHTQDAEAIWGSDCSADPCHYQVWKVSAGRFRVHEEGISSSGLSLRIDGWGVGSRWRFNRGWPRPDLTLLHYSLVK